MKKRLFLLLCLIVTAGSASALRVVMSGAFPNGDGGWQINEDDKGNQVLYISAEVIPDYKTKPDRWGDELTTAPWSNYTHYGYQDYFSVTVRLSPRVKTIGEYAFAGMDIRNVVFDPRTEPVIIKKGAFQASSSGYLRNFDFSYVKSIGEDAFKGCFDLTSNEFPMLEKCEADAFYYCKALAKKREIVLGKHVSISNLVGFKWLAKICNDGLQEIEYARFWSEDRHSYITSYNYWNYVYVIPRGSKLGIIWPVEGYGTKPDTFEGYSIENKTGGSGWSLSTTTGEFHLKRTVTASPV